jgi:hypothetical protein
MSLRLLSNGTLKWFSSLPLHGRRITALLAGFLFDKGDVRYEMIIEKIGKSRLISLISLTVRETACRVLWEKEIVN